MLPDPVLQSRSVALPISDVAGTADDLGAADVGADRDVGRSCLDHIGQPVRYAEAQVGLRTPQELVRKADPQPIVIMADLHLLEEPVVGASIEAST